jgi:hypothetical protein
VASTREHWAGGERQWATTAITAGRPPIILQRSFAKIYPPTKGKRMGSQPRGLAILSFVVSLSAIGLRCASSEECDYKTCGALMARDASVSWAVSGPHDYSPDTKRACAEFNACVRRAKNNSAGRAGAAPKQSPSPPPTTPIPAEVNAPKKQPPSPPPTTPAATQENTPNKQASPPPATKTIPFPD